MKENLKNLNKELIIAFDAVRMAGISDIIPICCGIKGQ
jgi:hypothetical protein